MLNNTQKKAIGLPLSVYSGVLLFFALGVYFHFMTPNVSVLYCIFLDVVSVMALGYISFSKKINLSGISKYAAITLTAIQLLSTINILSHNYLEISIIGLLNCDSYPFAFLYFVSMIAIGFLLYPIKVWTPTILFCAIQYIPDILLDGYIYPRLAKGNEILEQYPDYWDEYSKIINSLEIWQTINVVLAITALVFVLIWIFKKEKSPSAMTNPIEII